ncbi:glycosyltransferase family 4 protein [Burkholderiaceae bacterium]|nr:glycosyltransferase family 4 protein [Burkholderiaceae bacterium]
MKILIVSAIWPYREHSIRAANIVIFEMLKAFAEITKNEVGLLVVGNSQTTKISPTEQHSIDALQGAGIKVLQPLILPDDIKRRSKIKRIFAPEIVDRYPQCVHRLLIESRVIAWKPEIIIVVWSEWLTHACSDIPIKKFAYYGNPDPKAVKTQLELHRRSGRMGIFRVAVEKIWNKVFERMHLREMKKYEYLGDVAANDATYYARMGHQKSFYIQNIWMESPKISEAKTNTNVIKIIANIGKLDGTANTLGLEYLGKNLLPILKAKLTDKTYEIHLIGSGKAHPISAKALEHQEVIWRGFVDDIDREIRDCDVFLCVNNATSYKVGHTRYLHAWSLKAPVVAHWDASISMPEIQNGLNSLLGKDAVEIADCICRIVRDKDLARKIGDGGYDTYLQYFTAQKVAKKICAIVDNPII